MGPGAGRGARPKPHNQLVIVSVLDLSNRPTWPGRGQAVPPSGLVEAGGLGHVDESSHNPSGSLTFPGRAPREKGPSTFCCPLSHRS